MVNEYSCVCLHSDRSPQERKANLQAFKVTIESYTTEVSATIQLHTYNVVMVKVDGSWLVNSLALLCGIMLHLLRKGLRE